jgi:hypothetical protein
MTTRPSRPAGNVAIALVAVAAIAAAALGSIASTATTEPGPSFEYDPAAFPPGAAVVVAVRTTPGSTIFGVPVRPAEYSIDVAFTVLEQCVQGIEADGTWSPSDAACRAPAGIVGPISGLGRLADGDGIVIVRLDTTADCVAAVEPGMIWHHIRPACTGAT